MVNRPPVSPEIRDIVVRMWPQDVSWQQISALTGLGKNAIVGIAHRAGLDRGGRGTHPKGTIRAVVRAWKDGQGCSTIARANGLSSGQVYRIIKWHGHKPDPEEVDLQTRRAELRELWTRRGGCRWIYGDPLGDFTPCYADAVKGGDWCAAHRAVVYRRSEPVDAATADRW